MESSTEEEYRTLPLGNERLTFHQFGNATNDDVTDLCQSLNLSAWEQIAVRDVWARHPHRSSRTGKITLSF
jgi:hypothetical protein